MNKKIAAYTKVGNFARLLTLVLIAILSQAMLGQTGFAQPAKAGKKAEEQMVKAIRAGDFELVKTLSDKLPAKLEVERFNRFQGAAYSCSNGELVNWLQEKYDLGISDLQIAAIRGDEELVRTLLAKLDEKSKHLALTKGYAKPISSFSPLSIAVRHGHTKVVAELIQAGADFNEATRYTLTPLANAAEAGHLDIVKLLLKSGAHINAAPDGYTAVMRACWGGQSEAAKLLIDAGADIELKRHDGQRAIHMAAKKGSADCIRLLLKHKVDVNALAYEKDTALSYAELYKHTEVIKLLK